MSVTTTKNFQLAARKRPDASFLTVDCKLDGDGDVLISAEDEDHHWTVAVAREDVPDFVAALVALVEAGK